MAHSFDKSRQTFLSVVGVTIKHVYLLLLLLQAITNKPFVNSLAQGNIPTEGYTHLTNLFLKILGVIKFS